MRVSAANARSASEHLTIPVDSEHRVSALLDRPRGARALLVLAHGAGAGMTHPSLESLATGLAARDIATLRYQFPYMERASRRPDPPAVCHATVRAAVAQAAHLAPELALFAGGRSFGGRMTSQAQARSPLPQVRGLAFLAFPLHPAGRAGSERAAHLSKLTVPLLFIQGTRDALAEKALLDPLVQRLAAPATLHWLADADHAFHVPARSGRTDAEVREECLQVLSRWMQRLTAAGAGLSRDAAQ
jgi:uncharacterized protein